MFNKIKTTFYINLITNKYRLNRFGLYKEEIYKSNNLLKNRLFFIINDGKIGEEIYDIIKYLKNKKQPIFFDKDTYMKVVDYATNDKKIAYFVIEFSKGTSYNINFLNPLRLMVKCALSLSQSDYSLNYDKFKKIANNYDSFSEILSCFDKQYKDKKKTMETIIQCCHYAFSGKDFVDSYFKSYKNALLEIREFSYNVGLIKKCCEYYMNENNEEEVIEEFSKEILRRWSAKKYRWELLDEKKMQGFILNQYAWKENVTLKDQNERYTVFDTNCGEVTLFKSPSENFSKLCEHTVRNFSGEIVGYQKNYCDQNSFCFDFELEEKYNQKIKPGLHSILPDGRRIVIFKRPKAKHEFIREIELKTAKIFKIINEDENIGIINVSEIIYSETITDGMFECLGYITTPIVGEKLKIKNLLKLSNKELIYVFNNFFIKFSKYYISSDYVFMDSNFKFYINVLGSDFKVKKISKKSEGNYCKKIIRKLMNKGYNINTFIGYDFLSAKCLYNKVREFEELETKYCKKHDIYYTGDECPTCKKLNKVKIVVKESSINESNLVFEGSIAKHYKMEDSTEYSEYNIKLYKKDVVNIQNMENIINKIIISNMIFDKWNEHIQKCFLPEMKVYTENDQFIGYAYRFF